MRIVRQDPVTGELRLRLETASDLWRVARLIRPGDLVGGSTTRRDPEAPEETPGAQRERRRVWLLVRAEQVEFHDFSGHVRLTGPIVEGPFDIGRHHTLDLDVGDELALRKPQITSADRSLLDEGVSARDEARLLLASVDWGESTVVRLRGRVIEPVVDLLRTIPGKQFGGTRTEKERSAYAEELVEILRREVPNAQGVVVAGPGFFKEEVGRRLIQAEPSVKSKLKLMPTAESGRAGVAELLRSGRAAEVLRGSVAAEEADLVERLVTALGGGRRAAVGRAETAEAAQGGAVETLLVAEGGLRDPDTVRILDDVRGGRGRVLIVRDDGEPGRRLAALGGIGAILRFDWAPSTPRPVRGAAGAS